MLGLYPIPILFQPSQEPHHIKLSHKHKQINKQTMQNKSTCEQTSQPLKSKTDEPINKVRKNEKTSAT